MLDGGLDAWMNGAGIKARSAGVVGRTALQRGCNQEKVCAQIIYASQPGYLRIYGRARALALLVHTKLPRGVGVDRGVYGIVRRVFRGYHRFALGKWQRSRSIAATKNFLYGLWNDLVILLNQFELGY